VGRRLGQHFLARKSILDRIAAAACDEGDPVAIEIGPGKGALTECLLSRAGKVVAIEIDPYLVHYLHGKFRDAVDAGRLVVAEADVLKADLNAWGPAAITGNLPYYITSPILERVFGMRANWRRAVFMVQAEVAARLTARPGGRDFGYLSVLTQVHAQAEILFPVLRAAFHPPPKVDSAVVRLDPRDSGFSDRAAFLRFASVCFRHKRKTLRNNLAPVYGKDRVEKFVEARVRAEQMSIAELARLHQNLS
jgi:16S rRNA (adenine1518-N6/adenine1519-N6)-dimethyltransferase